MEKGLPPQRPLPSPLSPPSNLPPYPPNLMRRVPLRAARFVVRRTLTRFRGRPRRDAFRRALRLDLRLDLCRAADRPRAFLSHRAAIWMPACRKRPLRFAAYVRRH